MKLKKSLTFGVITLFSVTTLAACGGGGTSDSSSASGGGKASGEQVLRVTEQQEMPTADLSLATDRISFIALNNVYEGIYRLDDKSKPQPAGAKEKVQVSDDGLTYTVKLREEAKWSNGDPVYSCRLCF